MVLDLKELFINSQTSIIDPSVQIFGSLWQVVFLLAFFVLFEIIGYAIAWVIGMILKSALTKMITRKQFQQIENDFHKHSDPETIRKMSQYKGELEEELKETIDPEHQKELDIKIEQCETFLKEANKSFSGGIQKYRTRVLNGIKRAIKTIEKESKNLKSLELVLENLVQCNFL